MSSTKLVTVFGATGNQGGAVARSLLKNKNFSVRGITRNPGSDAAKALASLGAEMVKADGFNKDEMKAAFEGSWGAFVNTQSEDPSVTQPGGPHEFDLGKSIIDVAAEAGVKNLVYSSGADTETLTKGEVSCRMMMNKYKTLKHAKSRPEFTNVIAVDCGWYFEVFLSEEFAGVLGGFPLIPDEEGYLTLSIPRWGNDPERVGLTAVAQDYGDIVHGVLLDPAKYNGKLVQANSDIKSSEEIAATFEKVTGKKARVKYLQSAEEMQTYGQTVLEDVREMFRFLQRAEGRYYNGEETEGETAKALKAAVAEATAGSEGAALMSLEDFFQKHFGGK
ncbi:hypothetical protein GJ744_006251 [Endocarpon pusillum]|uniref:NmrA-like domain-containing protein n=1 Tax=Endocarpon pusillum TaxID=364733 RepID=A0A8H7E4X6_9EURO|nr:hypothetical protein GJ744_006251 [Endocarpon pusillum]